MAEEKITFENKITTPFTWVENDLIRSKSLSLEAIGLYLILRSFGGTSYPSVDYLCGLGKTGRDKLFRVINELIEAKLLLRKQGHNTGGKFSKTIYRIISLNDNYEKIYKEFIGEESIKPQTLDNSQSQPCPEKPYTVKPYTENPTLIRIIDKEESFKKESHTKEEGVCEGKVKKEIEKIKAFKIFKNLEDKFLEMRITEYGREVLAAAQYLEDAFRDIKVYNPAGLLIRTLKDKSYFEITGDIKNNNINPNINLDVEKLNMQYRGFRVYGKEVITEIINIGNRIAFRTNDITKDITVSPARKYEDFVNYLNKFREEFNTS